ncbi:histidinol-phosphatase [Polymorphobacter sp. PAMC 29334]|uniref:histidinol-phosphatase n=1 Tax=Polymorphobacter sp. PAMC 29334 TaxID=2862331 RepID=UPI001C73E729|nr:histidinol-phosphatase [Polymorphobacter sp. PAMC 29334]QYE35496.1 histidinol-phosphatase [Polymorphobacter sp. PAMC 29334]
MNDADIALIHRLADAAGAVIRPHFRNLAAVETKDDASPVTVADRAAEAAIREILSTERPGDGIIGEEYGEDRPDAARVWVIDPIDGTRAFIAGRPLFGTLIALLEDGIPVLGVIDQCIARDRWIGTPEGTTLNGATVRVRVCPALAGAHVGTTSPYMFDDLEAFQRVRAAARDVLYGGDNHNYGLVATGCLDLVVESGLKVYDWAALVPVVTGAGGVMTDWAGAPLRRGSDGRVVAAGDPALLAEVLATLAG